MAIPALNLLFGRKYAKGQIKSDLGSIQFDTVMIEEHKYSCTATQFPVEDGTIISDHILRHPDIVSISGIISDTPITLFGPFSLDGGFIPVGGNYTKSVAALNILERIQHERQLVTLVTGIKVYQNMALILIDVPRNVKTGQSLTFNLQFQRIEFVNNENRRLNNQNSIEGVLDNTVPEMVKNNTTIPVLQTDPPYSLTDQAVTPVSVGIQSLAPIPASILPQVVNSSLLIRGY